MYPRSEPASPEASQAGFPKRRQISSFSAARWMLGMGMVSLPLRAASGQGCRRKSPAENRKSPKVEVAFQCSLGASSIVSYEAIRRKKVPWGIRRVTAMSLIADTPGPAALRYSSTRTPPSFYRTLCGILSLCLRNLVAGEAPAPTIMEPASISF